MNKFTALLMSLLISFNLAAQRYLTEGAKLFFQNIKTTLTTSEKNLLFERSGLALSRDKKQFVIAGDIVFIDHPFAVSVLPTDLNNDGKEELFVVFGNSFTSGNTGSNILLFIKDKSGNYQSNFGFSGTAPLILPTRNLGYPDLLIGGPGFEIPIWRWSGKEYLFYKKITKKNLGKVKTLRIEEVSKFYLGNKEE